MAHSLLLLGLVLRRENVARVVACAVGFVLLLMRGFGGVFSEVGLSSGGGGGGRLRLHRLFGVGWCTARASDMKGCGDARGM